ncbi:MAG: hypothetical protein WC236_13695 [Gallionellaceae bacterium]
MSKNNQDSPVEEAFDQVFNTIAVAVMAFAFCTGYWVSSYVHDSKVEEAGFREKVNFCHDRMKDGRIAYIWRQEYCGKTLDAVDPISGSQVMGVIDGDEK